MPDVRARVCCAWDHKAFRRNLSLSKSDGPSSSPDPPSSRQLPKCPTSMAVR